MENYRENKLFITDNIAIPLSEIEIHTIRARGPGGQNVNKVATAIHLRFDISNSSLPDRLKDRLLMLEDNRITKDGIIIIKAQQYRSQMKNKEMALTRLRNLIRSVLRKVKKRIPTKPSQEARKKRMDDKSRRGRIKLLRKKVDDY